MQSLNFKNISIDLLPSEDIEIEACLLRLDKIHPVISGNKWFKLRFYIEEAIANKKSTVLTYGGPWSNHIVATAAACKLNGLQSIGMIRGERPAQFSSTLTSAMDYGMKLNFLTRADYKKRHIPINLLESPEIYTINEGGYGVTGALGAASIGDCYKKDDFTHICCAVGTGTMMAGLIKSALPGQEVVGISVLKNNTQLDEEVKVLLADSEKTKPYKIIHTYHFGGYAKYQPALTDFMNDFYQLTSIATDFVYTGKLLFGIYDLARKNYFPRGSRILVIHSGGLQGNNSLPANTLIF